MKMDGKGLLVAALLGSAVVAHAETITVGPGNSYDFPTVQQAIDAAASGDYVDVAGGTYAEDLTINDKNLIVTGSSLDPAAVTIVGSVNLGKGTDTEIQYLTIDAVGRPYGIKTAGTTAVKYGRIRNGKFGIQVLPTGSLSLYEQVVSDAARDGVYSRRRGQIRIEDSTIEGSVRNGVRVVKNKEKLHVTESIISGNRIGILMQDSKQRNFITKSAFNSNNIGVKYIDAAAYTSDNTFSGNKKNKVVIRSHSE